MSTTVDSGSQDTTTAQVEHSRPRVDLFGARVDVVRMSDAIRLIFGWLDGPAETCRYVVTPNVDHTVMLRERDDLRAAYHDASLVLADGWPVVAASRMLGKPLPERVPGSDLVPGLFAAVPPEAELTVFLLGAAPGVAEIAAERIHARWPRVRVVGTYSPPLGFEHQATENEEILARISAVDPQLLVVALGAPKQELWVHQHFPRLTARVALCVGATIDFLAGQQRRAPRWMQKTGLEWFYRLVREPRRMAGRYGKDALVFPQLVLQQWWRDRQSTS